MALNEELIINKINIDNETLNYGNEEHKGKLEKVYKYLNKDYDETFKEHLKTVKEIKFLEEKIAEIYNAIAVSEKDVDPNFSLFSPVKTTKGILNSNLYEEVHIMENELQNLKFNEKMILSKLDNISNVMQCINYCESQRTDMSKSIENYKMEDALRKNNSYSESNNADETIVDKDNINESNDETVAETLTEVITTEMLVERNISLLENQEIERSRIAMELHDSIVQNLTSLIHKSELCTKLVDMDSIRTKLELQSMIASIKNTIKEIRMIIYNLKPMSLEDLGLRVTVDRYLKQIGVGSDIHFSLLVENDDKDNIEESIINITAFRMIQESCNNSIKHSNCNNIEVKIDFDYREQIENCDEENPENSENPDTAENSYIEQKNIDNSNMSNILIVIEDDGDGFKTNDQNQIITDSNSYGLSILRERSKLLSGKIDIGNNETGSARVRIIIPHNVSRETSN